MFHKLTVVAFFALVAFVAANPPAVAVPVAEKVVVEKKETPELIVNIDYDRLGPYGGLSGYGLGGYSGYGLPLGYSRYGGYGGYGLLGYGLPGGYGRYGLGGYRGY